MKNLHLNCMKIIPEENLMLAGTKDGYIRVYDFEGLLILSEQKVSDGTIQIIEANNELKACLSTDFQLIVFKVEESKVEVVKKIDLLNIYSDDYRYFHSASQCLCFDPENNYIVTKSANGALLYISTKQDYKLVKAVRIFDGLDIISASFIHDGKKLLVGSNKGTIALLEDMATSYIWEFDEMNETIHWFCEINENTVVVANDNMRLLKIDPISKAHQMGPIIANDDFEYVSQLSDGSLLATSFDRKVYKIDFDSLEVIEVLFEAPFKIRWCEVVGNNLYLQVRDGSIFQIDINSKQVVSLIKDTRPCLWSACQTPNGILIGGENNTLIRYNNDIFKHLDQLNSGDDSYIKRIDYCNSRTFLAKVGGELHIIDNDGNSRIINTNKGLRDLAVSSSTNEVYIATEQGTLEVWDFETGIKLKEKSFLKPCWALSLSPNDKTIAVAERIGRVYLLDSKSLDEEVSTFCRLPKRVRWVDDDNLLITHSSSIDKITRQNGEWEHLHKFFTGTGNTIEDYCWDEEKKHLFAVTYGRRVCLFNFKNGELMDSIYNGIDLLKGLFFFEENGHEKILVFGRDEEIKTYGIHNHQLHPIAVNNIWQRGEC